MVFRLRVCFKPLTLKLAITHDIIQKAKKKEKKLVGFHSGFGIIFKFIATWAFVRSFKIFVRQPTAFAMCGELSAITVLTFPAETFGRQTIIQLQVHATEYLEQVTQSYMLLSSCKLG